MRVWLPDNIGVPFVDQISPEIIRMTWVSESESDKPPPWVLWTSKHKVWHIRARETAVRKFAHLARKEFNMLQVYISCFCFCWISCC